MKKVLVLFSVLVFFNCSKKKTCSDGIQNQGEIRVDCGGPCSACATCFDGVQNQGEVAVDCGGGICAPCLTCTDGIQNQAETGIDCGGPCAPCQVMYPDLGFYGENLLRTKPILYQNSQVYSLAANLPASTQVKVKIYSADFIWYVTLGSGNWKMSTYSSTTRSQDFITDGPVKEDLKIYFNAPGKGLIEIFENNATFPTRAISLNVQ